MSLTGPQVEEQPFKPQPFPPSSQIDSSPTLQRAAKLNPAYEPDPVSAQYHRRLDDNRPQYVPHGGKELSKEDVRHIYQNSSLSEEVGTSQRSVIGVEVGFHGPLSCLGLNEGIAGAQNGI